VPIPKIISKFEILRNQKQKKSMAEQFTNIYCNFPTAVERNLEPREGNKTPGTHVQGQSITK